MLQMLKDFLSEVGVGDKPVDRFDANDERLAAAALLIHVMLVDGKATAAEEAKLRELLARKFDLDEDATNDLVEAATAADREAVDLYSFTSLLNRSLNEDGRRRIVRMMWEMVYADGEAHELEDNVVWRIAELIGIDSRDRIAMRQKVQSEMRAKA